MSAIQDEVDATLARPDPSGALDERLLEVGAALVGEDHLAEVLQPYLIDLQLRDIARGRLPTVASPVLPLGDGEAAVFESTAEALEPATVKGTRGGYAGTRVRVSKDVSLRLGAFGAESSNKRVEMHATDRGTLTVTTERAVFIGTASTTEFRRTEVLTTVVTEPALLVAPAITFHFAKRRPIGFRMGWDNVRLLAAILGLSSPAVPAAAAPSTALPPHAAKAAPPSPAGGTCPTCRQPYGNSWLYCVHCGARITT